MASKTSTELLANGHYQVKRYQPGLWDGSDRAHDTITTASEWFSRKFPEQVDRFGCPFLELRHDEKHGITSAIPVLPNEEFFAAILGGDKRLGHEVVFYQPERQFYFRDVRDNGVFKVTSEPKLRTLLSIYFLNCAEELPNIDPRALFRDCRSDEQLQRIVVKARSILAADESFFILDGPNVRAEGTEAYGQLAKTFIQSFVEPAPGKTLTVSESYALFKQFSQGHGLVVIDMPLFRELMATLIQREYGLGLRNDVPNLSGKQQRGWRGVSLREYNLPVELLQKSKN